MVDKGDIESAARLVGKRLSDSTQFRYDRRGRGLAWQKRGEGMDILAPISSFPKGAVQALWKEGVKPVIDWTKAEKSGGASNWERHKAFKGAVYPSRFSWGGFAVLEERVGQAGLFGALMTPFLLLPLLRHLLPGSSPEA